MKNTQEPSMKVADTIKYISYSLLESLHPALIISGYFNFFKTTEAVSVVHRGWWEQNGINPNKISSYVFSTTHPAKDFRKAMHAVANGIKNLLRSDSEIPLLENKNILKPWYIRIKTEAELMQLNEIEPSSLSAPIYHRESKWLQWDTSHNRAMCIEAVLSKACEYLLLIENRWQEQDSFTYNITNVATTISSCALLGEMVTEYDRPALAAAHINCTKDFLS